MRSVRITTNIAVADIEAAKGFYTGFLGLGTEESTSAGSPATPTPRRVPTCSW